MSDPVVPPQPQPLLAFVAELERDAQAELDEADKWRIHGSKTSEAHHRTIALVYHNIVKRLKTIHDEGLRAAAPVVPAERPHQWAWKCLDCNAWTLNVGRGQHECGNCHTIKPFGASLVTCEFQPPAASAADRVSALTSKWQPIATAPTDGRMLLLYPSSCWTDDTEFDYEVSYWDEDEQAFFRRCDPDDFTGFTHWMPLPDPPTSALLDPAEQPAPDPKS